MGEHTEISWCDATFNGWFGCQRVSPGCENCYAETLVTTRLRLPVWGPPTTTARHRAAASTWKQPFRWNRKAAAESRRLKVFCSSLADVFEDHPQVAPWRADLFGMIEQTEHLVWLLLTKRPEHIRAMLPKSWLDEPRANVWLGTTVEDQRRAYERIPHLLAVPAVVRFLSCEPLLEHVDLDPPQCQSCDSSPEEIGADYDPPWCLRCDSEAVFGHWLDPCAGPDQPGINWVIVGGESGPDARPFALEWARNIVRQCREAGVAPFVKQLGARPSEREPSAWPNGYPHGDRSVDLQGDGYGNHLVRGLTHRAGADPAEWPPDLRIREFPDAATEVHYG
jgi:protein gp37